MGSETCDGDSCHDFKLEGKNDGATMNVRVGNPELREGVCINIYVNNNVQGVNNSMVMQSEVKMTNPGVNIYLEGLKLHRRMNWKKIPSNRNKARALSKRKRSRMGEVEISRSDSQLGFAGLSGLLLFSMIFFLGFVVMSLV
ncbi:hypothetical protein LINPERPRIM_LOCUS13808 [Linum perenne]